MSRFFKHPLGVIGLGIVLVYFFIGLYAPFLASSHPIVMVYDNDIFFPLFRYLFYTGYYSKPIDLFFNLLMFTLPLTAFFSLWSKRMWLGGMALQTALFVFLSLFPLSDPVSDPDLANKRNLALVAGQNPSWSFDKAHMSPYAHLMVITEHERLKKHHERIRSYLPSGFKSYTPYVIQQDIAEKHPDYNRDKEAWIESEKRKILFLIWPLIREFHWEDDAGGDQSLNLKLPWWEITRVNRRDFVASLIFGIRVSLAVGFLSITIAFAIGCPIGAFAGFYAGKVDIFVSRLLEVWEAMPTFFMLLLIVSITESKSIFIVIFIIGLFGWTSFSRYIRGEYFKQRHLSYVEACQVLGFSDTYTMFKHVLPNAIPPVLTLLPFAILGAITAEAGLSFLGLGEEGSSSWGVLMDEGRQAFPGESYLLWPPAILLTVLLIAIALVGDALRDTFDPRTN